MAVRPMIECPYCLAQIPPQASMCQHCGQQVALLLATRKELEGVKGELATVKAALPEGSVVPPLAPEKPWSPTLAVVVFYIVSIVALAVSPARSGEMYDAVLLVVMATLLGSVIAHRDPTPNVWSIAMYALAQPAAATLVLILVSDSGYLREHSGELVRDAFRSGLQLAAAAWLAAIVTVLFGRKVPLASALRLPTLETATGSTERAMKLISGLVSAVTVVSGFVAVLVKLLSPNG